MDAHRKWQSFRCCFQAPQWLQHNAFGPDRFLHASGEYSFAQLHKYFEVTKIQIVMSRSLLAKKNLQGGNATVIMWRNFCRKSCQIYRCRWLSMPYRAYVIRQKGLVSHHIGSVLRKINLSTLVLRLTQYFQSTRIQACKD